MVLEQIANLSVGVIRLLGSSPSLTAKFNACLAQLVEQNVANVQVAGSNPVARTTFGSRL